MIFLKKLVPTTCAKRTDILTPALLNRTFDRRTSERLRDTIDHLLEARKTQTDE